MTPNHPQPLSDFVQRMRELLDRIVQARTDWDRREAEREMAEAIQRHARPERPMRDVKQLQTGERV